MRRFDAEPLPPLTEEEVNALQDYAARHGRSWKRILNNAWMGVATCDDGPILRRLRNTHGPSWLDRYRPPKPQAEHRSALAHEFRAQDQPLDRVVAAVDLFRIIGEPDRLYDGALLQRLAGAFDLQILDQYDGVAVAETMPEASRTSAAFAFSAATSEAGRHSPLASS